VTDSAAGAKGAKMPEPEETPQFREHDDPFMGYSPPDPDAFAHDWGEGVGPIVHMNELFPQKTGADLGRKKPAPGNKLMGPEDASMQAEWMYIDAWTVTRSTAAAKRRTRGFRIAPTRR